MFVCAHIPSQCASDCMSVCWMDGEGEGGYVVPLPLSFKSLLIILQTETFFFLSWQKKEEEGKSGLALRASSREEICYLIFIGCWCLFW